VSFFIPHFRCCRVYARSSLSRGATLLQNGFAPALLRLICPHGKHSDPSFFEDEDEHENEYDYLASKRCVSFFRL
jgi:hypothetical protein